MSRRPEEWQRLIETCHTEDEDPEMFRVVFWEYAGPATSLPDQFDRVKTSSLPDFVSLTIRRPTNRGKSLESMIEV